MKELKLRVLQHEMYSMIVLCDTHVNHMLCNYELREIVVYLNIDSDEF